MKRLTRATSILAVALTLSLTAAAHAVIVSANGVTASANPGTFGSDIGNIINNSGLSAALTDANYDTVTHALGFVAGNTWVDTNATTAPDITFTFASPTTLNQVLIWNYTQNSGLINRGVDTFGVQIDTGSGFGGTVYNADIKAAVYSAPSHTAQVVNIGTHHNVVGLRFVNVTNQGSGDSIGLDEVHFRDSGTNLSTTDVTPAVWTGGTNYNRVLINTSGVGGFVDNNAYIWDDETDGNARQQYMWFDFSSQLGDIPEASVVTSAELTWAVASAGTNAADTVLAVFAVPDANKGMDSVFAAPADPGSETQLYYTANSGSVVDEVNALTAIANGAAGTEFDVTSLVQGWQDGSIAQTGQLMILNGEGQARVIQSAFPTLLVEAEGLRVRNGSFELPDTGSVGGIPDEWTGVSFSGGTVQENIGGFEFPEGDAPDGEQWLFLNNGGGVTQRIGAIADPFSVAFSFTQFEQNNIGDNGSGVQIELWDGDPNGGGTLLDSEAFAATGNDVALLRQGHLDPMGTQTDLYILLRAITDPGNPSGTSNVSIDNLQIVAVPTPAALPAGLVMLGVAAARRRRK